jgi:hypothetical protein
VCRRSQASWLMLRVPISSNSRQSDLYPALPGSGTERVKGTLGNEECCPNWEVSWLQRSNWKEMTILGLKFGVLNEEVSSWQRCPLLRKIPLYEEDDCALPRLLRPPWNTDYQVTFVPFYVSDLLSCVHGPVKEHDIPVRPWNMSNVRRSYDWMPDMSQVGWETNPALLKDYKTKVYIHWHWF